MHLGETATLKECKQCGATKPIDAFSKSGVRKGVQQYRAICKLLCTPCHKRRHNAITN